MVNVIKTGEEVRQLVLSREAVAAADDRVIQGVDVPEWGGIVHVRSLSSSERDAYEDGCFESNGADRELNLRNARARLVVAAACTPDGAPLFRPGDVEWLGGKAAKAMTRVFEAASRLAGMSAKDMEQLIKKSERTPDSASSSGSPSLSAEASPILDSSAPVS